MAHQGHSLTTLLHTLQTVLNLIYKKSPLKAWQAQCSPGARMAGKYTIDLSSVLAHEYGHALTDYFAGEKTHIFIGTTTSPVDHTLTSSNGFTIVGYPLCGVTRSTRTNMSRTIEAASYAAGPLCGSLYDLTVSALLKKCGLKESDTQEVSISLLLTGIISNGWINLIAQSALPISLATHTKTKLIQNMLNLLPIEKGCDGYEFLRAIGLPETIINKVIAPGATLAACTALAYSMGILSSLQDIYRLLKAHG